MTKQRRPEIIYKSPYRGYAINAEFDKGHVIYKPILDNTFRQLEAMLDRHTRVFTFRFDLHLPNNYDSTTKRDTQNISNLFNHVTAHLKKKAKKPRVGKSLRNHVNIAYQWAKEKGRGDKNHFHCWIAVDGNINFKTGWPRTSTSSPVGIAGLIAKRWEKLTDGTLAVVPDGRMLTRTDPDIFEECIYHYSYLAKTKDKYHPLSGRYSRNHGCSHLSRLSIKLPALLAQRQLITISVTPPRISYSPIATNNRIKPHIRGVT